MASRVAQLTAQLTKKLGAESAANEVRWLRDAFRNPRSLLYVSEPTPDPHFLDTKLSNALNERLRDKPLQYIIGTQPFGHIEIKCRPPVLIPRPETEQWTLQLAKRFAPTPRRRMRILDLGCGTGCISLLLAKVWQPGSVWIHAVDINPHAVELARENARDLGLSLNPSDGPLPLARRVKEITPSVFTSEVADYTYEKWKHYGWERHCTSGYFDLVVCNPPYIPETEWKDLDPSVRDWEDRGALIGGIKIYNALANLFQKSTKMTKPLVKRPSGVAAVEFHPDLLDRVRALFQKRRSLKALEVWHDQYGKKRVIFGSTGKMQHLPIAEGWKIEDGHLVPAQPGEPIIAKKKKKRKSYDPQEIPTEETQYKRGIWGKP